MVNTAYRPGSDWAIYLLAAANVALHLFAATKLEYHRDELLYFSLGYHPDFGYPSVPPLVGWLAGTVRAIFGGSVLAVKLLPALLSGGLVLLFAATVKEVKGGRYAALLACSAAVVAPVFLRAFHLFQPVHLELLWWTILTWLTLRYVNTEARKYLLYLGVALGLALLTKYLVLLYAAGLLLGLLVTRPATFREPYLYGAGLLALLIFTPNLIWQITHDFPVFGHLEALNENQLVNVNRWSFLTDQLLMAFTASVLLLPGLVVLISWPRYRFAAIAAIFTVIVLLILKGKSYYTIGLFPVLIAAGAVWWESMLKGKVVRTALPVAIVGVGLPLLPLGLPVVGQEGLVNYFAYLEDTYDIAPGRTFEDGSLHALPQDYADQLGWRELAAEVAAAYRAEADKPATVIYCENYGQAGALTIVGQGLGLPQPIAFSDAFNYWVPETFSPEVEVFYYINDELGEDIRTLFAEIEVVGRIDNELAREHGTTVYRCSEPRRPFQDFWSEVMAREPSPF